MRSILGIALLLPGCGSLLSKPDVRPIEQALATALPVAYVATLATAALAGVQARCTSVVGPVVSIEVSAACPLPLVDGASGTITVSRLGDPSAGILAAVFTNVDVGQRSLVVRSVDVITVVAQPTMLQLSYVDQDVKLTSPSGATLKQSSWVLVVDPHGTPGDPSDDSVAIDGAHQLVDGGGRTTQTALTGVKMDGGCKRNPIAGEGIIETADGNGVLGSTGVTTLTFHSACDGRGQVGVSLTSAVGSSGSTVALDLLN